MSEATVPVTETVSGIVLKLSPKERSTQMVVYNVDGRPGSVRFSKSLFPKNTAPAEIPMPDGVFGVPVAQRAPETKEERKARLAAKPKPTTAEKIARLQKKIAKLQAAAEAPAEQPAEAVA